MAYQLLAVTVMLPDYRQNALKAVTAALSDEEITLSNAMVTLMTGCIVVRNRDRQSHTVISLARISEVKVIKSSCLALLAISVGLFIVAAAALFSNEGGGAEIPAALLGALCLIGYLGSRSASIALFADSGPILSVDGKRAEAAAIAAAVQHRETAVEPVGKRTPHLTGRYQSTSA